MTPDTETLVRSIILSLAFLDREPCILASLQVEGGGVQQVPYTWLRRTRCEPKCSSQPSSARGYWHAGPSCPRLTMRYAAYNLSPRLTDAVPFLSLNRLLARTFFCSHHERQLSSAKPPSTHTWRKLLCKPFLPVLRAATSWSNSLALAVYHLLICLKKNID
jgi:hypothetical protein